MSMHNICFYREMRKKMSKNSHQILLHYNFSVLASFFVGIIVHSFSAAKSLCTKINYFESVLNAYYIHNSR